MDEATVKAIFSRIDALRVMLETGESMDSFISELRRFRDEMETLHAYFERVAITGRVITS